jgi:hypothetical protein
LEGCDSTTELLPQNPAVSYQPSAQPSRNFQISGADDQD